jgi:hypothetical protein
MTRTPPITDARRAAVAAGMFGLKDDHAVSTLTGVSFFDEETAYARSFTSGPVCDSCWLTDGEIRTVLDCGHGGVS